MKSGCFLLGCGFMAFNAFAISYDVNLHGLTAPAGSSFVPTGGSLAIKNHNGFQGLGISGGGAGGEIDLAQSLGIVFDSPQRLSTLTLAFLYDGPEYADGNERAAVKLNQIEYVLTATGPDAAIWTGSGSVINISPATSQGGAIWTINFPDSMSAVQSFELYPLPYLPGEEAPNVSDFSLSAFSTTPLPDTATTVGLLGVTVVVLGIVRHQLR